MVKATTTTTRRCRRLRLHRRRSRSRDTLCSSTEYINRLSLFHFLCLSLVSLSFFFLQSTAADAVLSLFPPRHFPRARKEGTRVYAGERERDPSALRTTSFAQRGANYPSYPTRKSRPRPSDGFNFISIFSLAFSYFLPFFSLSPFSQSCRLYFN